MKFLSAADFDDAITAAGKVRAATSYALPAIGSANTAYTSGNFEAYVPVGQFASGIRPGYGFYAAGVLGTYLYAETAAELRLRTSTGLDYTLWHSGNSRSDSQNDARYSQLGHTHAISDVTGLQAALDSKNSGNGTAGRLPKYATASTFTDSLLSESGIAVTANGGIFTSDTPTNTNVRGFSVLNGGVIRWGFGKAGNETGSDAGSDFTLWAYTDAGAFLREALRISRATGNATFSGTIAASGGNSGNWNTAFSWGNHASAGYVPSTRTLTINGATFDLSADRSWTITTGVTGTGTSGKIVQFTGASTIGDSIITISGINATVSGQFVSDIAPSGTGSRGFGFSASGVSRWTIGKFGLESGSDSGSNLSFFRFNDAGGFLGEALNINRANGNATFSGTITASGGNSTNWNTAYSWGNHATAGYVPGSRTLTINGTSFDLSANRTWTIDVGVTGTGTAGKLAKFATGTTLTDSIVTELSGGIRVAGTLSSDTVTSDVNARGFTVLTNGVGRWITGKAGVESGSNSGSDWVFWRLDDSGTFLGEAMRISRANANVTIAGTVSASGGNSTNWNTAYGWGNHASAGYVPGSRTITINGTTFDLTANRSWTVTASIGSGTNGFVTKWNGSTLADSSINDSNVNYLNTSKGMNFGQDGSRWSVTAEPNPGQSSLIFYNPALNGGYQFSASASGMAFVQIGSGYIMSFLPSRNVQISQQLEMIVSTGTAPFVVTSTTMSPNLNADMVDGLHASSFALASSLSGYVPTTRTITINGTTLDLSANRSWTIASGIGGRATTGRLPKMATSTTLTDSLLSESGISIIANGGIFTSDTATNTNVRGFSILNGSVTRWGFGKAGSETGSDAGSDFTLWAYNDAGTFLREPLRISRATGNATFSGSVSVSGGNSSQWNTAYGWGNHASAGYALSSSLSGYVPTSRTITINGTTFDLSANRSWTISAGGSSTLAGLSDVGVSGLANWQSLVYFNGQWTNINLNTVDQAYVDQQDNNVMTWASSQFVPLSRTITINGTTMDLSSNRSWTISGGVSGSGSLNMFTKWSGSGSVTTAEMYEVSNAIYVGSSGNRRHLVVQGSLVPLQMSASERSSYSPGFIGAVVYQTDGTQGLYVAKDNGSGGHTWVYVG